MKTEIRQSFGAIGFTLSVIFGLILCVGLAAGFSTNDNMFYYAVFGFCLGIVLILIPLLTPIKIEDPTKERDALR